MTCRLDRRGADGVYFPAATRAALRNWSKLHNAVRRSDRADRDGHDPQRIRRCASHAILVDEHPGFIVHDRNGRAMTPQVRASTSAQSGFQDFTTVSIRGPGRAGRHRGLPPLTPLPVKVMWAYVLRRFLYAVPSCSACPCSSSG